MARIKIILSGMFIIAFCSNMQSGVLIDNASANDKFKVWKELTYKTYKLQINYLGSGSIILEGKRNRTILPLIAPLTFSDTRNRKVETSRVWEKINAQVTENIDNNIVQITGITQDIKQTFSIKSSETQLSNDCTIKATNKTKGKYYRIVSPIFNYDKSLKSFPFAANLKDGKNISGNLCRVSETIKNIRILELSNNGSKVRIEYKGLNVELSPGPAIEHPIKAYITMFPEIINEDNNIKQDKDINYSIKVSFPHQQDRTLPKKQDQKIGLSQLTDPRGFNQPIYRWNAYGVQPQGNINDVDVIDNNYAKEIYNDDWDFNEGDLEGISRFSSGINKLKVKDGKLSFTTGQDAYFYWGNHFAGDSYKPENISINWLKPRFFKKHWYVKIRLKQSAAQSTWTVATRRGRSSLRTSNINKSSQIVKGSDWQTVTFKMPWIFYGGSGYRRCSLAVEPGDKKNNNIEIDWIKLVAPEKYQYLRYKVFCPEKIKKSTICIVPKGKSILYINGEKVAEINAEEGIETIKCGKFFKEGENIIAYKHLCSSSRRQSEIAILEGIIKFKDGTFKRIFTNKNWKGTYKTPPANWFSVNFNDSKWENVRVFKKVTDLLMPGGSSKTAHIHFADPPYLGPVEIIDNNRTPHIFDIKKGIHIGISLPANKNAKYEINYSFERTYADNNFARAKISSGNLKDYTKKEDGYLYSFKSKPNIPGVYDFIVEVKNNGKILDKRYYEIALVGKIPQKETYLSKIKEAIKLELVDSINCGNPLDSHSFVDGAWSGVRHRGPASSKNNTSIIKKTGKYSFREVGSERYDWFSYIINIKDVYQPHMIEITYLDDRYSCFEFRVTEQHRKYFVNTGETFMCRNCTGVYTGGNFCPNTNIPQKTRMVYYPRWQEASIDIINLIGKKTSPAIIAIKVYKIKQMPALKLPFPSSRLFGDHSERRNLQLIDFYAGPDADRFDYKHGLNWKPHYGYYRNWFSTLENQIKYMRFTGQNLAFHGFLQYNKFHYHSKKDIYPALINQTDNGDEFLNLMFDMFAANNLYLLPCIEHWATWQLFQLDCFTDDEVKQGAPTVVQVNRNGKQICSYSVPMFNPAHPKVIKDIADIAREITEKYSYSKAFAGIGVIGGGIWTPDLYYPYTEGEYFFSSYDDFTIKLFKKKTGIEIPIGFNDPQRFSKRYKWIMEHARKQWIDFRCWIIANVYKKISEAIKSVKPDSHLYIFHSMFYQPLLADYIKGNKTVMEVYRYLGFDPKYLKDIKDIYLGFVALDDQFISGRQGGDKYEGVLHQVNSDLKFNRSFDNGTQTAAYVRYGFFETLIKPPRGKKWLWKLSDGNPMFFPGHRYFASEMVKRLICYTPHLITYGFQDMVLSIGHPGLFRKFAASFRSIPDGQYNTLSGKGLDNNIVIRQGKDKIKNVFYIVNPGWWDLQLKIRLSDKTKITNLVSGSQKETDNLMVTLAGNEVKIFRYDIKKEISILSAEVNISDEARDYIRGEFKKLDRIQETSSTDFKRNGINIKSAKTMIANARNCCTRGDYWQAERIINSYVLNMCRKFIDKKDVAAKEGSDIIKDNYRVICAQNKPYTDKQGKLWSADQSYNNGINSYGYLDGYPIDRTRRKDLNITGTFAPRVYETERAGMTEGYIFKVPPGTYTIKLHFAQTWGNKVGLMTPPILINGKERIKSFDILSEAEGYAKPLVKTIAKVKAENGKIKISFGREKGGINGIEISKE